MSVRAIFFDAVGTLIHLRRSVGFEYRRVAQRHGIEIDERRADEAFVRAWKGTPAPAPSQGPRPDDDKGWWREVVSKVIASCEAGGSSDVQSAFFEELYEHFARGDVWEVYPEVHQVLEILAGRFQLAVLSNFDRRLLRILRELDLINYFQHIVVSSEVGVDKPDPAIFRHALALLKLLPAEVLHVGDDPVMDWRAAEQAGLRSFKLDREVNSLRLLENELDRC